MEHQIIAQAVGTVIFSSETHVQANVHLDLLPVLTLLIFVFHVLQVVTNVAGKIKKVQYQNYVPLVYLILSISTGNVT
jgi:hypothetical protein